MFHQIAGPGNRLRPLDVCSSPTLVNAQHLPIEQGQHLLGVKLQYAGQSIQAQGRLGEK